MTRKIRLGNVEIGGGAPVSIQSMTNTDTGDAAATLSQIRSLAALGCQIIRCAIPTASVIPSFQRICEESPIPVVADIHFDSQLAIRAMEAGAHGIRVNPGNLLNEARVREVAACAAKRGCCVRIGVNSGSLPAEIRQRHGNSPEAFTLAAQHYIELFQQAGCDHLKVSLKSSDVRTTVETCRRFAQVSDIPQHIGITEAGPRSVGLIKSAAGLGALLLDGIGDTLRVSLTAPPEEEVLAARRILEAVGLRQAEPEIIACPTCGRTSIDLFRVVEEVERGIEALKAKGVRITVRKVAIMGCEVNGPGEAKDADVGIAGSKGRGILFRHGVKVKSLPFNELVPALLAEMTNREN